MEYESSLEDSLPLTGVRVVEISHMVMGPTCGLVLSQLGAEVIKIEPPSGDKTRSLGGMGAGFFPLFARGKKSVVLDLGSEDGHEAIYSLLATADVFIENFRSGTVGRMGLDLDQLARRFPELIICSHKGFLRGPYEHRPALDEVVQMMTGLAAMTGSREKPMRAGASVNDIMGGLFGVIGVLAALMRRDKTKLGGEVRVGLFENSLFLVAQHMVQYQLTGKPVPPMSQRTHAWPIYDYFDTADRQRIFVAVTTDGAWRLFCNSFGFEQLLSDPDLRTVHQRIEARNRVIPLVADRLRQIPIGDLETRLEALDIPFSRINMPEDLLDDPHVRTPGRMVEVHTATGTPYLVPALPLELGGRPVGRKGDVAAIGADTVDVLASLGFGPDQIARASGVEAGAAA
jgi:crotonobetainyl-CoA:carnitine CoA-transferase CaiB-like acyl-CoA transferase